jgi:hypothetical protein
MYHPELTQESYEGILYPRICSNEKLRKLYKTFVRFLYCKQQYKITDGEGETAV